MCFVRAVKPLCNDMLIAAVLSTCKGTVGRGLSFRIGLWLSTSHANRRYQHSSLAVVEIAIYSASADDKATMDCLLLFHPIG